MHKRNLDKIGDFLKDCINSKIISAGYSLNTTRDGRQTSSYIGYRDINNPSRGLMDGNTIIRLASGSKIICATAFLKLVDKGLVKETENLDKYIPEFHPKVHPGVIVNYTPFQSFFLTQDPLKILESTLENILKHTLIEILHPEHNFVVGDWIGIQGATGFDKLTANQLNQIFQIVSISKSGYQINITTRSVNNLSKDQSLQKYTANSGGNKVVINKLAFGVKQTKFKEVIYYYTTIPLTERPTILNVLNHSLGYTYFIRGGSAFGYASNKNLQNIQAGIMEEKKVFTGLVNPYIPKNLLNIVNYVKELATIPLLFQPGEQWSYGPTISILGALVELIDGREAEQYIKEEIFDPLEMTSSGFFIQNDDPTRLDKINRILTLNCNYGGTLFPITKMPELAFGEDYFYGVDQPKKLVLYDSGIYSTPDDFQKFLYILCNKGLSKEGIRIISPKLLQKIFTAPDKQNTNNNLIPAPLGYNNFKKGLGTGLLESNSSLYKDDSIIFWNSITNIFYSINMESGSVIQGGTNLLNLLAPVTTTGELIGKFNSKLLSLI